MEHKTFQGSFPVTLPAQICFHHVVCVSSADVFSFTTIRSPFIFAHLREAEQADTTQRSHVLSSRHRAIFCVKLENTQNLFLVLHQLLTKIFVSLAAKCSTNLLAVWFGCVEGQIIYQCILAENSCLLLEISLGSISTKYFFLTEKCWQGAGKGWDEDKASHHQFGSTLTQ